jgi:hypothetical protein
LTLNNKKREQEALWRKANESNNKIAINKDAIRRRTVSMNDLHSAGLDDGIFLDGKTVTSEAAVMTSLSVLETQRDPPEDHETKRMKKTVSMNALSSYEGDFNPMSVMDWPVTAAECNHVGEVGDNDDHYFWGDIDDTEY